MSFGSILFERADARSSVDDAAAPEFFADLNLDQFVDAVTAGRLEYRLEPLFSVPLRSVDAIAYRHEVLRDLEEEALSSCIASFAGAMRSMRSHLAQAARLRCRYQQEAWFLDAVEVYCRAVRALAADLSRADVRSRGFLAFREYLGGHVDSDVFTTLEEEARRLKDQLATVRYSQLIRGSRVTVSRYEGEADYSAEVLATFEKFAQGAVRDHRFDFPGGPEMNHVEAQVLELVARLHPDVFGGLDQFCARRRDYVDATIRAFDREVQFYVAYREFCARLEHAGLAFCYPTIAGQSKDVCARDTFDVALANKLVPQGSEVVCNDFHLEGPERVLVVTGPNQGGKTTFARMFGQLHHLAALGLPVPGREARLFLCEGLFTHFEREEDLSNQSGKLGDELMRLHEILRRASADSVVILNESFTSTTVRDALLIGTDVMRRIVRLGALCVCVTFIDELASLDPATVSMVSMVVPEDPASRTFKIVRRPADGLAYAAAIAEKHGLTYRRLKERIRT